MADLSDLELLSELGVDTAPEVKRALTPRQERVIAGFEDIQRFVAEHGRAPQHGDDRDIFERLYAVRLDQLRNIRISRSLDDADAFVRPLHLHGDFVRIVEDSGEQRITHVDGIAVLNSLVHRLDVLADHCGDLGVIRFRDGFHAVVKFLHFAVD